MSSLVHLIKKAAVEAVDSSDPTLIMYGKVTSVEPLKINIEQRLTLDESHFVLTNNVKDHKTELSFDNPAIKNIVKNYSMNDDPGSDYKLTFQQSVKNEITIYNGLKVGESVILLRVQGGQKFIVIDKI